MKKYQSLDTLPAALQNSLRELEETFEKKFGTLYFDLDFEEDITQKIFSCLPKTLRNYFLPDCEKLLQESLEFTNSKSSSTTLDIFPISCGNIAWDAEEEKLVFLDPFC